MIRTVTRGQDFSDVHDSFCRCRTCKRPHPNDSNIKTWAVLLGLGLLIVAIVVTI